jgi:ankyrin repeat protein
MSSDGITAENMAALNGHAEAVRMLLEAGADVTAV